MTRKHKIQINKIHDREAFLIVSDSNLLLNGMVRLFLDTGEQRYPIDISVDASVNRLEETIRVMFTPNSED